MLNFACIGAQKSATTWLYHALRKHPLIDFPGGKEVHYWDAYQHKGLDWYRNIFSDESRCNGDITPAYAILPLETIRKVHAYFPSLSIIYLVRNPIERAWSSALMAMRRAELEYAETSEQWFIDHFKSRGSLARGDHANCIRNWSTVYPQQSILIARYEDVSNEPVALMNRVLAHIGIDEFFTDECRIELSKPVFMGQRHSLPPALLEVLLSLYSAKIDALGSLLGRDFSEWKTGETSRTVTN